MPAGDFARGAAALASAAALIATASWADGSRRATLPPERAAVLWDAALVARNEHRPAAVLPAVQRLLASYPREARYLQLEASSFDALNNPRAAARSWEQYLAWSSTPVEACPSLGRAYDSLGDAASALDAHRRCLALDPEKSDLRLYYARALEGAGQTTEAENIYESILRESPGYSDVSLFLGRIKLNRGDLAGAGALIEPVLAKSPNSADPLLFGALVDLERGDHDRAETRLRRAIKSSPDYADLYRVLARVCDARHNAPCSDSARGAARDLADGHDPRPLAPEAP